MSFGRLRVASAACAAAVAAALGGASALADQQIAAGPGSRYLTTSVTMAQGERLTFANRDVASHDVTSKAGGPDGKPLFGTPAIGTGGTAPVEGSQYLSAGTYGFFCSIHPNMEGTLTVTSAGTPARRPAGDSRAPGISIRIASPDLPTVARKGKLAVKFVTDEAATVKLAATIRVGKRDFALKGPTREVDGDRTSSASLALSGKAKKAVAHAKKARVTVSATTQDASGNRGSGSTTRTLRR